MSSTGQSLTNKQHLILEHQKYMLHALFSSNDVTKFSVNSRKPGPRKSEKGNAILIPENVVTISDLIKKAGRPRYGKWLLCRTLVPTVKIVGLATVIDDPEGVHGVRLSLYDYSKDFIATGTILLIRNPWLKANMDGGVSVRCDDSADVRIYDSKRLKELKLDVVWKGLIPPEYLPEPKAKPGTLDYKRQGNVFYVAKEFARAVEAYSCGLVMEKEPKHVVELFTNRALAYLNLKEFQLALIDTEAALVIDPLYVKAHCRKVKALIGLEEYTEALEFLNEFSIPSLKDSLKKAEQVELDKLCEEAKAIFEKHQSASSSE